MIKAILLSLPIIFSTSVGLWINTDGSEKMVPCPESFDTDRLRLPQGCSAYEPGVWLSVDRYREMDIELQTLETQLAAKDEEIKHLEARTNQLQGQLILCTAVPECPACPDNFLKYTATGAALGSVISLGGCAAWNLSQ